MQAIFVVSFIENQKIMTRVYKDHDLKTFRPDEVLSVYLSAVRPRDQEVEQVHYSRISHIEAEDSGNGKNSKMEQENGGSQTQEAYNPNKRSSNLPSSESTANSEIEKPKLVRLKVDEVTPAFSKPTDQPKPAAAPKSLMSFFGKK